MRWKHFLQRQVDSHSNLGTFWNSRQTVSLFLRNIQVFCSLILKCKPHKRHLPSFPAFAGLMEVQRLCAFRKFERLWSLQYLFTLWRILHNPSALSGEVSLANRLGGSCCTWQKHYWLLRNHQRLFDRKRVGGGQQRSLSFLSFLPRCERLLLAGKVVVWSRSKWQLSNFARFWKNLSSLGLYKSNFENNSLKALLYEKNDNFETGAGFSMFTQTAC